MQYTRFLSSTFAFAMILSAASATEAQRPVRDPVAPPRDATSSATSGDAPSSATPLAVGQCQLTYERADNMWAALGRPDGDLGEESINLNAGQTKVLSTDWQYEKKRNDGVNYYGSHMRVLWNRGSRDLYVVLVSSNASGAAFRIVLPAGIKRTFHNDLREVTCPS